MIAEHRYDGVAEPILEMWSVLEVRNDLYAVHGVGQRAYAVREVQHRASVKRPR